MRSVLGQTFTDFELLLIDDGSTDGSDRICDELASEDRRIVTFHTDNHGVSAARNLGLSKATGRYISFIDADDRIDETFLKKLHDALITTDAGMAVCGYYEIRKGKKYIHNIKNYGSNDAVYELVRQDQLCILWNKLFVREKIRHLFDESISTCEDSIFCIRYFIDNDPEIAYVNETLYGYIAGECGLSSTFQKRSFDGINKLLRINLKLSGHAKDERMRHLTLHHVCRVYYYGIYTYIFENMSKGPMTADKLAVIEDVISDAKYQKILRCIMRYPLKDRVAEKTSIGEYLYAIFSCFKMKRTIYVFSKVKRCLEPLKSR